MSGKRAASYNIDPHTLEQTQKDPQINLENDKATQGPNKKQNRKIFKIKRPETNLIAQSKETKVSFKLSTSQEYKNEKESPEQAKKKSEAAVNIFQNLFKKDQFNGVGIFSNLKSTNLFTSNKKTEQSANNLTNNNNNSENTNIFGNPNKINIFSTNPTIKNTSASLFVNTNKDNTNINHDEEGSGDSAQLQQDQKLEVDPQKSKVTYDYGNSCPIILTLKALKFKKKGKQLIENVEVVLQKQTEKNMKYITVRIPVTKKAIYSGILVQNRSEFKHFNNKKQNVQIEAFSKQKQGFIKSILMFQFEKQEHGQMLVERLTELLKIQQNQKKTKETQNKANETSHNL